MRQETTSVRGYFDHSVVSMSDEAAEILSAVNGTICLSGITGLSSVAATHLSNSQGCLMLNGITAITDAVAESLSKHQGDLQLNGLSELSDEASRFLSNLQGNLSLDGLESILDSAAEFFRNHRGFLLSLRRLSNASESTINSLYNRLGYLRVGSRTNSYAIGMEQHLSPRCLSYWKVISVADSEFLSKRQGDLNLSGLNTISDAVAEHLSQHQGYLDLSGQTPVRWSCQGALQTSGAAQSERN